MATRDLTPQDEGNEDFVQTEEGQAPRGQTGDPAVDEPDNGDDDQE